MTSAWTREGQGAAIRAGRYGTAPYGLSLELPPAAQAPDGTVVRNMLMMWPRIVKPR